jgi:hypothetical protein
MEQRCDLNPKAHIMPFGRMADQRIHARHAHPVLSIGVGPAGNHAALFPLGHRRDETFVPRRKPRRAMIKLPVAIVHSPSGQPPARRPPLVEQGHGVPLPDQQIGRAEAGHSGADDTDLH